MNRAAAPAQLRHLAGPDTRPVLEWRFTNRPMALSSAAVGGGWRRLDWALNVGVDLAYNRTDLDGHGREVAAALGLTGDGTVLFTAADVTRCTKADDGGVHVDATVGITSPTWAAATDGASTAWRAGTINIVVQLPVALSPAAAVNTVITITEAKSQALLDASVPGTGTASDAVVVCWPVEGDPEIFAGPRSACGASVARAVYRAVTSGIERSR